MPLSSRRLATRLEKDEQKWRINWLRRKRVMELSKTKFVDRVFRIKVHGERTSRGGGHAKVRAPAPTGTSTSMLAIKDTQCGLVSIHPPFADSALIEALGHGVKDSIGFRHKVIDLAPNQTLAVGTL